MSVAVTTAENPVAALLEATKERARRAFPPSASAMVNLPGLSVRFLDHKPVVYLTGRTIAIAARSRTRRELIERLFSIKSIKALRLSWKKGEARLEFRDSKTTRAQFLNTLAAAMQGGSRPAPGILPHAEVVLGDDAAAVFEVHRATARELTLWQVDAPSPRLFRIGHPLLRFEHIRKIVLDELTTLSDAILRTLYLPLSGRESLVIFVQPHRLDPALFREALDPVLSQALAAGKPRHLPPIGDVIVNANLGAALVSDLVFRPFGLVSVAFTGLLAGGYVPRAVQALRQGKVNLEVLYLTISALSVLTLEFLPAAIMTWLMRYWPRRTRSLYQTHHARFLARYRHNPRRVWVEHEGLALEMKTQDLTFDNIITVNAGDIVPGDGIIEDGDASVDERLLTGALAYVPKSKGDPIYAATRIAEGSVRIKILATGSRTAAGRLAAWHSRRPHPRKTSPRVIENAERTVLPVLLLSALATLQGGFAVAKATLRPDYVSGPALSENLATLNAIIRAANEGILISNDTPLEAFGGPIAVIFDDTIAWQIPAIHGGTFAQVAAFEGVKELVYFSRKPQNAAAIAAHALGFERFHGSSVTADKLALVKQWQDQGRTVIYVGDPRQESTVAAQADVAVAVLELPFHGLENANIALLAPDLLKFLQLLAIARSPSEDAKTAFGVSLVPNISAALAAFFVASPVYAAILLSNLGTLANFVRSDTKLRLANH